MNILKHLPTFTFYFFKTQENLNSILSQIECLIKPIIKIESR
ncbi:conserved hypothetical protein [Leptospira interrogans serovar Manilae]|uniref:Uncharacterized protein n=1 Tax=Leptospira interrogans serovar Manilae TaxID=214675 RepID=A0AAQ1NUI4_LEPIR|nr:conserved hypothetical protein [Leptospira interrogans serovar Manilae]